MGTSWIKAGSAIALFAPGFSFAAVPAEVMTVLGSMKADALQVAAIYLVAIIAVAAFKFIRRGL